MHKRRGTLLIAVGLLLLLGAAGLTVYNINQDIMAGKRSDAVMDELVGYLADVPIRRVVSQAASEYDLVATMEEPEPLDLDGNLYMGLITIPRLGLQLPVQHEWSYPNLKISPCRMQGSPMTEDLVILAHNYQQHFGTINQLEAGDEVSVTLVDGTTYVYSVDHQEVVVPTAVEEVTSGEWPLTLFTCTIGGRTRVVVRCNEAE